jgi:hypothetical protein
MSDSASRKSAGPATLCQRTGPRMTLVAIPALKLGSVPVLRRKCSRRSTQHPRGVHQRGLPGRRGPPRLFRTLCPEIRNTRLTIAPVNTLCSDHVDATKFPFENYVARTSIETVADCLDDCASVVAAAALDERETGSLPLKKILDAALENSPTGWPVRRPAPDLQAPRTACRWPCGDVHFLGRSIFGLSLVCPAGSAAKGQ